MKTSKSFSKPKGGAKKSKRQQYLDVGMKYIKRVQKLKLKLLEDIQKDLWPIDIQYPVKKVTKKQIWKCVKIVNKAIHSKVKYGLLYCKLVKRKFDKESENLKSGGYGITKT